MKNIALLTAKGNNVTLENKNLVEIEGKSSLAWQIEAAQKSKAIDQVFVSTECPMIKEESLRLGATIIDRPAELAQAFTNHGDAILHGAKAARQMIGEEIGTVTILLGNTSLNRAEDIDECYKLLSGNSEADGVMTVWLAQDDHPFRAMTIGEDGYLKSFLNLKGVDTNRQSYPNVYFYDQGPWMVRYSSLLDSVNTRPGPASWWWMGKNVLPLIRLWVTGRDIHTQLDVEIAKAWIREELWKL